MLTQNAVYNGMLRDCSSNLVYNNQRTENLLFHLVNWWCIPHTCDSVAK